jgi:hypothetical protein
MTQLSLNKILTVGFEVLTAVVMKSYIFWDIKPCSPLKGNDVSAPRATCFHAGSLLGLFFWPEDEGDIFLRHPG